MLTGRAEMFGQGCFGFSASLTIKAVGLSPNNPIQAIHHGRHEISDHGFLESDLS